MGLKHSKADLACIRGSKNFKSKAHKKGRPNKFWQTIYQLLIYPYVPFSTQSYPILTCQTLFPHFTPLYPLLPLINSYIHLATLLSFSTLSRLFHPYQLFLLLSTPYLEILTLSPLSILFIIPSYHIPPTLLFCTPFCCYFYPFYYF